MLTLAGPRSHTGYTGIQLVLDIRTRNAYQQQDHQSRADKVSNLYDHIVREIQKAEILTVLEIVDFCKSIV